MATNRVYKDGDSIAVTCSHPAVPASGDPVRYGELVGVALTKEDTTTGKTSIALKGVWLVSVKGVDQAGNSAVAPGDKIFYVDADTPVLSKKNTGRLAGHVVETATNPGTVASAATGTVPVRLSN
jgi:predicted RecA/RadA family phage recombinase